MALDLGSAVGRLLLDTSGFVSGFGGAARAIRTFQSETSTTAGKFVAMGTALTSVGRTMTTTVTIPLIGAGAAATTVAANFESSMSQVQATMGATSDSMSQLDGQTVNTMEALSDLAQEMGASTKFSATEAAAAINNMAMAGYDVQEIYQSLPQVLSLASAGALDLDYATQLVANGLNVMGMQTSDAQELADKLAVTASNAYGSVSDFGEGLLVAGAQAKLANVSLTDTMTALGILGDNGISASEGGTYLRNTLKNLYTPTEDAGKALKELGVQTANSDGTLRDFQTVLGDLGTALDGLTEEQRINYMSRIFDTRTISAANALIKNSGNRWNELSDAIDNAGGAADQMAQTQLNNLSGQLTILKSSIEGAAISFGNILLPTIKKLATGFQNLMNWINGLDSAQQQTLVSILAIVAAIGPALLIFGKLAIAISSIIGLISGAGGLSAVFAALTGPIGLVIAAVAALVAAWVTDFGGIREATASIFESIGSILTSFGNFFVGLWESDFLGIQEFTATTWNMIQGVFSTAFTAIADIFSIFAAAFQGDWEGVWNGIKTLATDIWNGLVAAFGPVLESIVATLKGIGSSLYSAASTAFQSLYNGAVAIWETVSTWAEGAFSSLVEAALGIAGDLYNAGVSVITSLYNGLASVWGTISSWATSSFNSIVASVRGIVGSMYSAGSAVIRSVYNGFVSAWGTVTSWIDTSVQSIVSSVTGIAGDIFNAGSSIITSLYDGLVSAWGTVTGWVNDILGWLSGVFGNVNVGVGVHASGNFASGLDYVSHDGIVKVHEGEAILTKEENEERRSGKSSGAGDTYNFYSPKALNPTTAAREMRKAKQQLALGVG